MVESKLVPYSASDGIPAVRPLILAPHADDEVFGCGGMLAIHASKGASVKIIVLTDGVFGGTNERESVATTRQAESRLAANILGVPPPEFWGLPDRGLEYGEYLVRRLMDAVRSHNADLVYTPSLSEAHPDHRVLAMSVVEMVRRIGKDIRLAMYEVGVPLHPNHLVNITPFVERKRRAMSCFVSQLAKQRYDEQIAALNCYRAYSLPNTITAAEAFAVISAEELAHNPQALFASEYQRQHLLDIPVDGRLDLPLVSVVVRSSDRQTLAEALNSIALQTYPNIEVVVVNAKGGSHQDVGAWCGRYPLRLIAGPNSGLRRAEAANAGISAAIGEYVAFLDDDDTIDPDHFHTLVTCATSPANRGAVVYGGVRCIDRNDAQRTVFRIFSEPFDATKLLAGNFIPIHAVLFPRHFHDEGIRFDQALDVYEDWDFWLQLCHVVSFVHVDHVTATYFSGGSSGADAANPDAAVVSDASDRFYRKWHARIGGMELKGIADLYHKRNGELNDARADYRILAARLESLAAQLKSIEDQLCVTAAKLAESEVMRNIADMRVVELTEEVASVREALAAVYRSRSWRITAPLRRLKGNRE